MPDCTATERAYLDAQFGDSADTEVLYRLVKLERAMSDAPPDWRQRWVERFRAMREAARALDEYERSTGIPQGMRSALAREIEAEERSQAQPERGR